MDRLLGLAQRDSTLSPAERSGVKAQKRSEAKRGPLMVVPRPRTIDPDDVDALDELIKAVEQLTKRVDELEATVGSLQDEGVLDLGDDDDY